MKITAITRYKHGKLLEMLKQLGWTQSELAKRCGVAPGKICDVMNLVRRPSETLAIKIQNAFGEAGHYLDPLEEWPETFTGVGRGFLIMQSQDCDPVQFVGLNEAMQIEAPQSGEFEGGDLMDTLNTELATFSAREQKVIQMRYFQGLTYDSAAKVFGLTRERVRQIEAKVLRRLRSPERKKLAEWKTENALL